MDYGILLHDPKDFARDTFIERKEKYGFKSISRMELFLWDLELFLQIQKILGERIVLKGGAATQFYLPRDVQRTSVDIDMLFSGSAEEVQEVIDKLEGLFKNDTGLFNFKKHLPKNPKTALPLHTYFLNVPSNLPMTKRNAENLEIPYQELKIEFILQEGTLEFEKHTGENIFAVDSPFEYHILPLNHLFADKLTTLGSTTVGVQNDRMDEQVKQFYDILMLSRYCINAIDCSKVNSMYRIFAEAEWHIREESPFHFDAVTNDVKAQLSRYELVDLGNDAELKKYINDFHSLYLNSHVEFTPQIVACGASLIKIVYELVMENAGFDKLHQAFRIEKSLALEHLYGKEKGVKVREVRNALIEKFGGNSYIEPKVLQGKSLKRIFWAIVSTENIDEIADFCTFLNVSPQVSFKQTF